MRIFHAGIIVAKAHIPHYHSGFPEIDAADVTEAESRELEQVLLGLLQKHPESESTSSLIWALGKSENPAHAEEFTTHLERGLRMLVEGNRLVFQALCSLDRAHEDVFERDSHGGTSQCLIDVEKNLRQARAYLAKRGIQVPG